jgi:hypothetical protein
MVIVLGSAAAAAAQTDFPLASEAPSAAVCARNERREIIASSSSNQ